MEILKLLSASEIFAQIVVFLALLWFLRIFFWKRILKILDERREMIASEFKGIEDQKANVEKLKNEYEVSLAVIEETAKAKIQEAIQQGEAVTETLRKEAQEEGKKIVESARLSLKYEIANAKEQFREEIIDLVLGATQEVIEQKVTQDEDRKIVEDFIDKVDKA